MNLRTLEISKSIFIRSVAIRMDIAHTTVALLAGGLGTRLRSCSLGSTQSAGANWNEAVSCSFVGSNSSGGLPFGRACALDISVSRSQAHSGKTTAVFGLTIRKSKSRWDRRRFEVSDAAVGVGLCTGHEWRLFLRNRSRRFLALALPAAGDRQHGAGASMREASATDPLNLTTVPLSVIEFSEKKNCW